MDYNFDFHELRLVHIYLDLVRKIHFMVEVLDYLPKVVQMPADQIKKVDVNLQIEEESD